MIIAVDFDGTVVEHKYPEIGKTVPGAVAVLKKLVAQGHQLILWTMRSDQSLAEAVVWYNDNGIPLFGINTNPEQTEWTNSPKAYAQLYIDDAALGCPLSTLVTHGLDGKTTPYGRPFVDWVTVEQMLVEKGILANKPQPANG